MASIPSFDRYVASLGRLSSHIDPTASTPEAVAIKAAADELAALPVLDEPMLAAWVAGRPEGAPVLALAVGLTQERFKNVLRHQFDTSGWLTLARQRSTELIAWLEVEYDLIRSLDVQRNRAFDFGDVLVARAGTRVTAASAGTTGRKVEDEIEAIVAALGLPYVARTRFAGRGGADAPADIVIPNTAGAVIAVAAKGFDSTGSKLSDAVREVVEMATVRRPNQYVFAVIDGIGWKSRRKDLERLHTMWAANEIDGMYTLATLDVFRDDLVAAAQRLSLLP